MGGQEGGKDWLQNSSFDVRLFASQQQESGQRAAALRAELLARAESSSEGSDLEDEHGSHKRKRGGESSSNNRKEEKRKYKKHKSKEKRDKRLAALDAKARAAGPRLPQPQLLFAWAEDAERLGRGEADCLDRHRENDNLVYEKPYLMNIPAYRRTLPRGSRLAALRDDSLQSDPRGKRRRRFTTKRAKLLEADRDAARLRFGGDPGAGKHASSLNLPQPTFIPLAAEDEGGVRHGVMLSQHQLLRRRTIELNRATMEQPSNLQAWLDFADFQDEFFGVGSALRERKARLERDAAEKKVDILQKALQHHPASDEVVLRLMAAAQVFEEEAGVLLRWQALLRDPAFAGSWRLWQAHIRWQRDVYLGMTGGTATVADVRATYCRALKALATERLRLLGGQQRAEAAALEAAMVDMLVSCCRFDLQAGHTELAVARIQAGLEFSLLAPRVSTAVPGPGGDGVRRALFEQFWASGAPLIGEEGAEGWQVWEAWQQKLRMHPVLPPPPSLPPGESEEDAGGWSGWQELEVEPPQERESDGAAAAEGSDADEDASADEEEDEMEALRQQLEEEAESLQADASVSPEMQAEWQRWEAYRERCCWQPSRPTAGKEEEEDGGSAANRVDFKDVEAALFSLRDEGARRSHALRLLALLDAPLGAWHSSNSSWAEQDGNESAALPPSCAQLLSSSREGGGGVEAGVAWLSPDWLANGLDAAIYREAGVMPWYQGDASRRDFLVQLLSLLLSASGLSQEPSICAALVAVAAAPTLRNADPSGADEGGQTGEVFEDRGDASLQRPDGTAVRQALAELLKQQSLGSPLWTAYASHEALHGSIKVARKTFGMHLQNSTAVSEGEGEVAPLALAFAAAEVERKAMGYRLQALHVLCWLAVGRGPFQLLPQPAQPPSADRIAEARRGFQARLSAAVSSRAPSAAQTAVISAAALFEQLLDGSSGAAVAARLLGNALGAFPEKVRQQSPELEQLALQRCRLLMEASRQQAAAPKEAYRALDEAAKMYPRSLACMQLLQEQEAAAFTASRYKMRLRTACDAQPHVPLWLLAAKLEARQLMPQLRMRQLFKRSEKHAALEHSPLWQRVLLAYTAAAGGADLEVVLARVSVRCPWVKEVWVDGARFTRLLKHRLAEAERRDIRVRTSLEDVAISLAARKLGM